MYQYVSWKYFWKLFKVNEKKTPSKDLELEKTVAKKENKKTLEIVQLVNKQPQFMKHGCNFNIRQNHIPTYETFYGDQLEHGCALDQKWNMYSMIHNLYESYRFVLYNCSHRVANYGTIHYNSRIVLNIPKEPNMFILFHGNLVHSGAASKLEDIPFAMNYASDYRAFAYIDKFGNEHKNLDVRRRRRNVIENRGTHEDGITTTTFKCCDKMKIRTIKCKICDANHNSFTTNEGFQLNLSEAYDLYKKKVNQSLNILNQLLEIWTNLVGQFMRELTLRMLLKLEHSSRI